MQKFIMHAAMVVAIGVFASPIPVSAAPPDLVLINCDDLGYGDLGCYGGVIETPHVDAMAAAGLRLTSFYVSQPICTASRASLMTGCYAARVGLDQGVLRPVAVRGLAGAEITIAEVLKEAGYRTAAIGKWHLGFVEPFRPTDQGFDDYVGVPHNLDAHETIYFANRRLRWWNGDDVTDAVDNRLLIRRYTDAAVERLENQDQSPLFLYLAHAFPHVPLGVGDAFIGHSPHGLYGDCVRELDNSTGRILEAVKQRHDQTGRHVVVMFTSDNGPSPISSGSAGPLRGTKHTSWEGGLRVPMIVWGTNGIPSGRTSDEIVTAMDVLPSVARLCKATPPSANRIDGVDASAALFGGGRSPRDELLYHNGRGKFEGYRHRRHKIRFADDKIALYDLRDDIGESQDLASENPQRTETMMRRARELRNELTASARPVGHRSDLPKPDLGSPKYDVVINDSNEPSLQRAERAAAAGMNVCLAVSQPSAVPPAVRDRLRRSGIPVRRQQN